MAALCGKLWDFERAKNWSCSVPFGHLFLFLLRDFGGYLHIWKHFHDVVATLNILKILIFSKPWHSIKTGKSNLGFISRRKVSKRSWYSCLSLLCSTLNSSHFYGRGERFLGRHYSHQSLRGLEERASSCTPHVCLPQTCESCFLEPAHAQTVTTKEVP